MHSLSSRSQLHRFYAAAVLLMIKALLLPVSIILLIYSMLMNDHELLIVASILCVVSLFLLMIQWVIAFRARCPLCHNPPLAHKQCVKHRNARTLFGSYRLQVAAPLVFTGKFLCPYCGERTAMQVRQRHRD